MHSFRFAARLMTAALAAAVLSAAFTAHLLAERTRQEKAAAPLINGVWQLNATASVTGADLGGGAARDGGGAPASRGGRGGRGGGMMGRGGGGGGMSAEQLQKLRALIQDVTTMPQRLTINSTAGDVALTFDSGEVLRYATTGKEEKHDFTNGTVKVKTSWDGAVLTQHFDTGETVKLVGTYAVSGDQLVVTFARDTGAASSAAAARGAGTRPALERRWVYDAVKELSPYR